MVQKMQKGILALILLIGAAYATVTVPLPCDAVRVTRSSDYVVFSGAKLYGAPGQPQLPVYYCTVVLPPGADLSTVSFEIKGLREETVGIFSVKPALPQATIYGLCWPDNRNIVDGRDVAVYSTNQLCPDSYVEMLDVGKLHCFNVVTVRVNLARYNPVTQALVIMRAGALAVQVKSDPKYTRGHNAGIKVPASLQNRLKHLVVNFSDFADAYEADYTFVGRGKYVIIASSSTQSGSQSLDAFVQSKVQRGFEVEVVTESAWGGGTGSTAATNMRGWLADNYQTMGIEYVLIIGSSDASSSQVPMMMLQGNNTTEADFGYAQLTGQPKDDMQCEVSVGRIPIYSSDINTVDAILDKCITYESAGPEDITWRENALFGAGGYDSSTKGDKLFEAMHSDFVVPTTPWKDYRIYGTDYGQPSGTPDKVGISTTIFSGQWAGGQYGLVEWGTHGSSSSAQYVMSSSNTSSVGNDYPAYVLCGSCSNASVSSSSNLTYSILKNCGIGGIGGTHLTYYSPGQTNFEGSGSDQGWVYEFGNAIMVKKMASGDALNYMRGLSGAWWSNNIPYVLYGDPSLGIYTCKSEPFIGLMMPNGGEELEQGTTYSIKWSDNIEGNVLLELLKGGSVLETLAQSVPSNGSFDWEVTTDYEEGNDYKVRITNIDSSALKTESKDPFSIIPEFIIAEFPYIQDFDDMDLGFTRPLSEKWEQLADDDIDWIVHTGPTPSKTGSDPDKTGPSVDHTSGDGKYVYVEASDPNSPDKKAHIITPKFDLSDCINPRMKFYAHMLSAENEMGELYVDINVDGTLHSDVIHLTDDHGDEWFEVTQDLSDYKGDRVRVIIRGITGDSWCSDIAVDDFMVEDGNAIGNNHTKAPVSFDIRVFDSRIVYQVPEGQNNKSLSINLYTLQGKRVQTLVNGPGKAGFHSVSFNQQNRGTELAAGLYLCRMKTEGFTKTIPVVLKK